MDVKGFVHSSGRNVNPSTTYFIRLKCSKVVNVIPEKLTAEVSSRTCARQGMMTNIANNLHHKIVTPSPTNLEKRILIHIPPLLS